MYKTACNETSHLKSVHVYVTFYLIKPYQPFNQTRTSTTQNQTTFSLSLCIYSHISHSSQSYGQLQPRSLYIHKAIQNFSLALIEAGIINRHNTQQHTHGATDKCARAHAHTHTHTQQGKEKTDDSVAGEGMIKRAASGPFGTFCHHV